MERVLHVAWSTVPEVRCWCQLTRDSVGGRERTAAPPPAGRARRARSSTSSAAAEPSTRGDLAALTGLARSTVAQRVDALLAQRAPRRRSRRRLHRRPTPEHAGVQRRRRASCSPATSAPPTPASPSPISPAASSPNAPRTSPSPPAPTWCWRGSSSVRRAPRRDRPRPRPRSAASVSACPARSSSPTGRPVNPPIMPGWNLHPVGARLVATVRRPGARRQRREHHGARRVLDPLARPATSCSSSRSAPASAAGIVAGGRVHRGADGAAGDIGHIHVADHDDVICRCGNVGLPRGRRRWRRDGGAPAPNAASPTDDRSRRRRPGARRPTRCRPTRAPGGSRDRRRAGRPASTCSTRRVIVIGGDVADADEPFLAGIREVVYRRSLPLATGRLQIVLSDSATTPGSPGPP